MNPFTYLVLLALGAPLAACGARADASDTDDAGPVAPTAATPDGGSLRAQARAYARDDIPCTSDSDCCVVTDMCTSTSMLVGAADRSAVRNLIDRAYDTERDDCNLCIAPAVEVSCGPAGYCVGIEAGCSMGSDHCGRPDAGVCPYAPNGPLAVPRRAQAMFGCGI
jgi:hypothetical protein